MKNPVPAKSSTTISENTEKFRDRLARDATEDNAPTPSSPEVMLTELQNLRKKYDAVVEYTVHLTAERDSIVAQLEDLQRELNKERSKRKEGKDTGTRSDKIEKKIIEKVSFSYISCHVIYLILLLFFHFW